MAVLVTVAMSEAALQKAVLQLAKAVGWRIFRHPATNMRRDKAGRPFVMPLAHDSKGFFDTLLIRDRVLAVEFKTEQGKLTPAQQAWHSAFREAGIDTHTWRPSHWRSGEIEAVLRHRR